MRTRLAAVGLLLVVAAAVCLPAVGAKPQTSARQMKAIVHAWSDGLNAGDNDGIARLFGLPAVVIQNDTFRFRTYAQLAEFHRLLPCAGHIRSIAVKGQFATAVFRLGDRMGSPCESRGVLVAARFEIAGGKIVSWQQIPVPEQELPGAPGSS